MCADKVLIGEMNQFQVWNLHDNDRKYDDYIKKCVNVTPFHLTEYLLAEAKAEDGITKVFVYQEGEMFALIPEVIRKINALPYMHDLEEEVYDMVAPHEYGGIVSNSHESKLKYKLLKGIAQYCRENNIIFQFIRMNPYLRELPMIYQENGYQVIHSNRQVYIDLRLTEEQIFYDYKSNVRRNIRRAQKEGLMFEIAGKNQDNINCFQRMYQKAMERLKARKFLYFNAEYFRDIIGCEHSRLVFVKDTDNRKVAGSILLLGNDTVYYHLGCFDWEYSLKRPMNFLMHSMILWSKREGYTTFHLAGGHKSLMQFKEGYANTRIDYYIAYKICDDAKYQEICNKWRKLFPEYANEQYYPLYRYNA